jgi:hypothetical protein
MNKLYLYSKKIHRLLVMAMVALGFVMSLTGFILGNGIVYRYLSTETLLLNRQIHAATSTYFALVLLLMTLSGLAMYIFPLVKRRGMEAQNEKPSE